MILTSSTLINFTEFLKDFVIMKCLCNERYADESAMSRSRYNARTLKEDAGKFPRENTHTPTHTLKLSFFNISSTISWRHDHSRNCSRRRIFPSCLLIIIFTDVIIYALPEILYNDECHGIRLRGLSSTTRAKPTMLSAVK